MCLFCSVSSLLFIVYVVFLLFDVWVESDMFQIHVNLTSDAFVIGGGFIGDKHIEHSKLERTCFWLRW